jgi:hypothetical protein
MMTFLNELLSLICRKDVVGNNFTTNASASSSQIKKGADYRSFRSGPRSFGKADDLHRHDKGSGRGGGGRGQWVMPTGPAFFTGNPTTHPVNASFSKSITPSNGPVNKTNNSSTVLI